MRNTIFILLAFTLLLSSCKKENTVWETDWSAPVINDSLHLNNLVNDSTLAVSSGYYVVDLHRTLLDRGVNDVVSIPDTTISKNYPMPGNFVVTPGIPIITQASENDLGYDDVELKQIISGKGIIDFTIRNPVEASALLTIEIVGAEKNGVPFSEVVVAGAGTMTNPSVTTASVDISGYSFDLTGIEGNERNILTSKVTVVAQQSVQLLTSQVMKVDVTLRDVELAYARGYFGNQVLSDTTDFNLEIMKMVQSGTVDVPASTIKFEIENGIKVGASGLLTHLTSENTMGGLVNLAHPQIGNAFTLNPATGGWNGINPSIKEIIFDQNNSNMEQFIENLGHKYTAGYKVEINPWGNISAGSDEIYPDSRFKVRASANLPLAIGMDNLVVQDTFPVDLIQTSTTARVAKGELLLKARNAFPIAADVKLMFLNANKAILHSVSGSDIIQSAEYGSVDASSGLKVMDSDIKWVLSADILDDLENIKYIIVQSKFDTPNGSTGVNEQFQIPAGAFIGVKLRTRFTTENQF